MLKAIGIITVALVLLIGIGYISLDDIQENIAKVQKLTTKEATEKIAVKGTRTNQIQEGQLVLTTAQLQNTIEQTPAFQDFPEEGSIVLSFFDGNGYPIPHQIFTITKEGVEQKKDKEADFIISTGNYWIPEIQQSSDFCKVLKEIKANKDYTLKRNIGIIEAALKYQKLRKYKGCFA